MASKQDILQVLKGGIKIGSTHVRIINPEKTFDVLKIDTKYFDNADSLESTQAKICEYFYRTGEVWKRINNVINTQSKEKNDQLEKDYGIRVVFSDKD
ncbi:hypothetical protein ABC634_12110 [Lentilactobacillus parabuchneri]|jgi:uncharacterized membrane-anchored protein YhcB (DUF1043 family)|uniref:Uncharacterized protein n=1 Tax=Lentilactobacillus parabuchneri TaxID=152331 RepID=A0A844EEZ7_9LACO|nr:MULTISPECIES: hypothetical protein [Lentilactobacillus]MBW0224033.1 hypothetical protein [Lentilactobacillus parabuchneri]MBW0246834.1 hypothetical protein [Lentilactobacillus parabuchneri]MBW0264922.1 hypothetical protein [Lentilactobacillus parabuchneri]MCT3562982.1 hypothetical protein [Lentilactobacillus buchneri]MSE20535.1 hypothetical protein [Lentilactobacillus parabuchneri]